jgi:hypothetical protein
MGRVRIRFLEHVDVIDVVEVIELLRDEAALEIRRDLGQSRRGEKKRERGRQSVAPHGVTTTTAACISNGSNRTTTSFSARSGGP